MNQIPGCLRARSIQIALRTDDCMPSKEQYGGVVSLSSILAWLDYFHNLPNLHNLSAPVSFAKRFSSSKVVDCCRIHLETQNVIATHVLGAAMNTFRLEVGDPYE